MTAVLKQGAVGNPAFLMKRVSDPKQKKKGYSLAAQEEFGLLYCKENSLNVIENFEIVETASKVGERYKFNDLLKRITDYQDTHGGQVHLVVEKSDRLSRNHTDKEKIQRLVLTGRLVLHYFKEKKVMDEDCSPEDIFIDDINTSRDKYTSLNLARETSKGCNRKAKEGWFPGWAPYGYKNIREGSTNKHGRQEAKIVEHPVEKPIVLKTLELMASGKYSYFETAKSLRESGLVPNDMRFTWKTVEQICTERLLIFYSGRFKYKGNIYEGNHPVFVPREWIISVMERKGRKSHTKWGLGTYSHLIRCKYCDSAIVWCPKKKVLASGEIKIYDLYWCADSKKMHRENKMKIHALNEAKIDQAFEQILESLVITETMSNEIATVLKVRFENFNKNQSTKVNALKERLQELGKREDRLYDDYYANVLEKDAYKRQCERLKKEKIQVQEEIGFYGNSIDAKEAYQNSQEVLELAKSSKSLWKLMKAHEKRTLMKTLCLNQRLDEASVESKSADRNRRNS